MKEVSKNAPNTGGQVKVSIIIANYNYCHYLNRSIRSAFIQNYPVDNYEIITVDDSSSDWSREIIDSYGKLIKAIYLDKNAGLATARNRAVETARGKYILFLDADDYLNRDIVFIESTFLDFNPEWDAIACDYYYIDDNEQIIGRSSCFANPIACGIMFVKDKLIDIGMYDEEFRVHEDKDLQIRFSQKYKIHHIELPLYRYRQHGPSLSNNEQASKDFMEKLKRKHNLENILTHNKKEEHIPLR